VEDTEDGIECVPVFEQNLQRLQGFAPRFSSGTIFTMSRLRLHEFHAILDPTKVTHKGALWWITWQQACTSLCWEFAAESCRSVIENRRICIWLIISALADFFATYRQLQGPNGW
jgi:hypothetical protein